MVHRVYTVRDAKGEVFGSPFLQKTHGEAERTFKGLANSKDTFVGQYPDDFDLYYLGNFDDVVGKYDLLDTPQHICKAVQVQDLSRGAVATIQQ